MHGYLRPSARSPTVPGHPLISHPVRAMRARGGPCPSAKRTTICPAPSFSSVSIDDDHRVSRAPRRVWQQSHTRPSRTVSAPRAPSVGNRVWTSDISARPRRERRARPAFSVVQRDEAHRAALRASWNKTCSVFVPSRCARRAAHVVLHRPATESDFKRRSVVEGPLFASQCANSVRREDGERREVGPVHEPARAFGNRPWRRPRGASVVGGVAIESMAALAGRLASSSTGRVRPDRPRGWLAAARAGRGGISRMVRADRREGQRHRQAPRKRRHLPLRVGRPQFRAPRGRDASQRPKPHLPRVSSVSPSPFALTHHPRPWLQVGEGQLRAGRAGTSCSRPRRTPGALRGGDPTWFMSACTAFTVPIILCVCRANALRARSRSRDGELMAAMTASVGRIIGDLLVQWCCGCEAAGGDASPAARLLAGEEPLLFLELCPFGCAAAD